MQDLENKTSIENGINKQDVQKAVKKFLTRDRNVNIKNLQTIGEVVSGKQQLSKENNKFNIQQTNDDMSR